MRPSQAVVGEVLSGMGKRNVITPYAKNCWSVLTSSFVMGAELSLKVGREKNS